MWGWKPVEWQVKTDQTIDEIRALLVELGFFEHFAADDHVVLRRSGSELASEGEKLPLELAIASSDSGLLFQLRYDTFVLFDTGDLKRIADKIVTKIEASQ